MNEAKALTYCNRALVQLGATPIVSLNEHSAMSEIALQAYEGQVEALLSASRWEFATLQAELARITDIEPLIDWQYAYQLPTNPKFLLLTRLATGASSLVLSDNVNWPRLRRPLTHAIRTVTIGDAQRQVLLTNYSEVFVEYVGRVDESMFPPYFEQCVEAACAIMFAQGLTNNEDLLLYWHERLHGGVRKSGLLGHAIMRDRINTPRPGLVDDGGLISGR